MPSADLFLRDSKTSWLVVCGLALAALLSPGVTCAADPQMSVMLPRGGQRGTEVELRLYGARLEDAVALHIYEPGIEVLEFAAVNGGESKAKIRIAPDCPLGSKHFRVRTMTGITESRTFTVSALPTVLEVEPNNDFAKPQVVPFGVTIEGTADTEDVDYFAFEAKKGDRITAEVEGIRLGDTMFDVYVAILNSARFELSTSDDMALVYQDGVASVVAPADGTYIVQLRESAYGGHGGCRYRCHVGPFPRPVGLVPSGGPAGSEVAVKFFGETVTDLTNTVLLPQSSNVPFGVFATDEKGIAPSPNYFRLSSLPNTVEQEPNLELVQATEMTAPGAANGVLMQKGDTDRFVFAAQAGQVFDINVYARRLRSELDAVLYVFNERGEGLASNDDANNSPDSAIRFTAPADGKYYLSIFDHLGKGGPGYFYRIEVEPITRDLQLTINEFQQFIESRVVIPQGGAAGFLVNAARKDFGGALEFIAENLPPGVALEAVPMAGDQGTTQLLLTAAADAPLGASFAQIYGKLADPNQPAVQGRVRQDAVMVRGQNNIPFWTEPLPSLMVAVSQAAPFTISLVEPKVPLVRGGSMQLKVVATRAEGFTAPIRVELFLNPNGVNSSRSVAIAEGQTEAIIDMNAAGNAALGTFRIVARAEATVGNGNVVSASRFINLTVAEPYLQFAFQPAAVEQGKSTEMLVNVETSKPFEGTARVQLVGLPNKVTTPVIEITKETKDLVFPIAAEAGAPPGQNKSLYCQVIVTENGEPIVHNIGTGQLRVDEPIPMKVAEPMVAAPAPMPAAAPMPEQPPAPKRLTRLEQLRLEQKQRVESKGTP